MRGILVAMVVVTAGVAPVTSAGPRSGNERPLAEAGLDQTAEWGTTVYLDAGGSRDPDGRVVDYEWTITAPNGSTLTPDCPNCVRSSFEPTQTGEYAVTITVTDDDGATATDTLYVDVDAGDPPKLSMSGPRTVATGASREYVARVRRGDPPLERLVWSRNGTVIASQTLSGSGNRTADLQFPPGRHTLTATVVDAAGRRVSRSIVVRSVPPAPDRGGSGGGGKTANGGGNRGGDSAVANGSDPPLAVLDANRTVVIPGGGVALSGLRSRDRDRVGNGSGVTAYRWDADGDGNWDHSTATVGRRYRGNATVRLQVRDDEGNWSNVATERIVVTDDTSSLPPEAAFSVNDSDRSVVAGRSLALDARSARDRDATGAGIVEYDWYVDGASVGTGRATDYDFETPGDYDVTLQVTDDEGATGVVTKQVHVAPDAGDSESSAVRNLQIVERKRVSSTFGQDRSTVRIRFEICLGTSATSGCENDVPASEEGKLVVRWEREDGRFERVALQDPTLEFVDEDGGSFEDNRKVEAWYTGPDVYPTTKHKVSDWERVSFCLEGKKVTDGTAPSSGQRGCETGGETGLPEIDLSITDSGGAVPEGDTVNTYATIRHQKLYDTTELDWEIYGYGHEGDDTGGISQISWLAERRPYNYEVTITGNASATKVRTTRVANGSTVSRRINSSASDKVIITVCHDGVADGGCAESSDNEQDRNDGRRDDGCKERSITCKSSERSGEEVTIF